jgi:hypothetical protein
MLAARIGSFYYLGRDRILGMGDTTTLPPQLIAQMHIKNVRYLFQARDRSIPHCSPDKWLTSDALGLNAEHAILWNSLCSNLALSGIILNDFDDHLSGRGEITLENSQFRMFIQPFQIHSGTIISEAGENTSGPGTYLPR